MIKINDKEFKPLESGKVKMYVCGPTVYDVAHLGHGRSAVAFDVIRKYLEYKRFDVTYVSNYTDVDDKMINRAREEGITVKDLALKIIPEVEKDYLALGIKKPDIQPRATEYVEAIVDLIKKLEAKGFTYLLDDGVYYDVSKFPEYGRFSGQTLSDLQAGARVEVDERKKDPCDFALWKLKKEDDEPSWPSPWGDGRPGWHIECSAMTWKTLGEKFDIHGGGLDLKFPHHECEVAQSLAAFGPGSFARYWMHNGFIQINNEKMSKSLGNFFTLKEIFEKYDPRVVRFMFLQTHYRNPINFSDQLLEQAKSGLSRLHDFVRGLSSNSDGGKFVDADNELVKFEEYMDNDFDTAGALGVLFELVKVLNSLKAGDKLTEADVLEAEKFLKKVDSVLGIIYSEDNEIPSKIVKLAEERVIARKAKDFKRADQLRDEIKEKGYVVEDTASGFTLKKEL